MGPILAPAIPPGRDCFSGLIVSHGQLRLRIDRRSRCVKRVWIKSFESTLGDTRAYRHAACTRDFSDRTFDLAKNPPEAGLDIARSSLPLRTAYARHADQRPDRLRFLTSRDGAV